MAGSSPESQILIQYDHDDKFIFIALGDHLGPQIPKISPQIFCTKIVHTSGTFFKTNHFSTSHIQEKDTESEYHIQKNQFMIQNTPTTPKHFRSFRIVSKLPEKM